MKLPLLHDLAHIFATRVGVASHGGFAIPSTNQVKYLFTNVLAIIVFSLVRCLCISFTHSPPGVVSFVCLFVFFIPV